MPVFEVTARVDREYTLVVTADDEAEAEDLVDSLLSDMPSAYPNGPDLVDDLSENPFFEVNIEVGATDVTEAYPDSDNYPTEEDNDE